MQIIDNWLMGKQNYFVGLAIINSLSKDTALKALLSSGPNSYNTKRLYQELVDLNRKPLAVVAVPEQEPEAAEMPDSDDDVLMAIKNKWMGPYQEMNYLRHQLDVSAANDHSKLIEERRIMAKRILELEKICNQHWSEADYYKKHGKLPNEKESDWPVPTDPKELANAINTCKKNIRRNRLMMAKNPENPVYAKKYTDYKAYHKKLTGDEYKEEN